MLALIALSAAQARIGQTQDQVIQDAGREKAVSTQWVEILGRTMLRVQYHDDVILHLFGSDGREIAFYYYATKGLKPEDVAKFQRKYRTTWHGTGTEGGHFSWESDSGLYMAAERLEMCDYLVILDMTKAQEIPEIRKAMPAKALASAPVAPAPKPLSQFAPPTQPDPAPVTPSNPPVVDGRTPNDCYVIASQIYAKLKTSSHWVKVAGITIKEKSTNEVGGHAVVFSQLTPNSNIVMSDENGGLDLQTKSHDLQEITDAAAQISSKLPTAPYIVQSARWIDGNQRNQVEYSSATGSASIEQTTELIITILLWILVLSVTVICFLKGKPVFGVLGMVGAPVWPIIGAIRIAKPDSWWARKKYGPKKMEIAHRRFTPQKVQETKPGIIDDPVERALERVKRNNPTVVSQPDEAGPRPGRIKTLLKAIASVIGTLFLWIGIVFSYTYFLIACLVFLTLWRGEYFSLIISALIAIGLCIILRYVTGAIVLAGIALQGLASDDNNLEADYA